MWCAIGLDAPTMQITLNTEVITICKHSCADVDIIANDLFTYKQDFNVVILRQLCLLLAKAGLPTS